MVEANHWDQWGFDGFGACQPLVTMVFDSCPSLVLQWNGFLPSLKSIPNIENLHRILVLVSKSESKWKKFSFLSQSTKLTERSSRKLNHASCSGLVRCFDGQSIWTQVPQAAPCIWGGVGSCPRRIQQNPFESNVQSNGKPGSQKRLYFLWQAGRWKSGPADDGRFIPNALAHTHCLFPCHLLNCPRKKKDTCTSITSWNSRFFSFAEANHQL